MRAFHLRTSLGSSIKHVSPYVASRVELSLSPRFLIPPPSRSAYLWRGDLMPLFSRLHLERHIQPRPYYDRFLTPGVRPSCKESVISKHVWFRTSPCSNIRFFGQQPRNTGTGPKLADSDNRSSRSDGATSHVGEKPSASSGGQALGVGGPIFTVQHREDFQRVNVRKGERAPGSRMLGRKALVTGGSSGIGRAIAKRFVEEGADSVAIVSRSVQKASDTIQAIRSETGLQDAPLWIICGDLSQPEDERNSLTNILNSYLSTPYVSAAVRNNPRQPVRIRSNY